MNHRKIRSRIMACLPASIAGFYRRKKQSILSFSGVSRRPETVFSEIYRDGEWGGGDHFNSGAGTASCEITTPYLSAIREDLEKSGFLGSRMVDLGCGNFIVGAELVGLSGSFTAVDVVPSLIEHLRKTRLTEKVRFEICDLVATPLPDGDVAFLRQVLQHLSNEQIMKILPKLEKYSIVYITEHLPSIESRHPNLDKSTGGDIRLGYGSGVYLDLPPFNLRGLDVLFECPGHSMGGGIENGVIRTYRYTPSARR